GDRLAAGRPASTSAACGWSVTKIALPTWGQSSAAATVSAAIASASAGRSGPARLARRVLARASTLTGTTRDQVSGAVAGGAGIPGSCLHTGGRQAGGCADA